MPNIIDQIKSVFFDKAEVLPPGLYNYQSPADFDYHYRLHLRIEPGGLGLLIINASTVLHLNQTATELAYYLINQIPKPEAVELMVKRYQINFSEATRDYEDFMERIETLINTPDLDPVTYLDFERQTPYTEFPIAPYRLDCALTYKLNDPEAEIHSPKERVTRELSFDEWKTVLKKAWEVGIPHVIFTGGEPTLRPNIVEIVVAAEDLGMVTGLSTDGLRLAEKDFLEKILNSGLDHLLITFDPTNDQSWQAIKNIIPEDIHTTVHLTIDQASEEKFIETLNQLKALDVENISLSYKDPKFEAVVVTLRNVAAELGFNLEWDLPVPYSQYNPVSVEINDLESTPEGAGKAWLYIEPDGDVFPAQGITSKFGNILEDSWDIIWNKAKEFNQVK
ncbi:MAG TPA: radical SAM protein [Anaerolineaceae bacterium]|nr:radical SAM protein [Anaerolineaceae bacterium]